MKTRESVYTQKQSLILYCPTQLYINITIIAITNYKKIVKGQ